jgi:hypothetical protein
MIPEHIKKVLADGDILTTDLITEMKKIVKLRPLL